MFCKYCGKENKDGQKFCKYCGKGLQQKPDEGSDKSGVNKLLIAVIGLLVLVLIAMGIFMFLYLRKGAKVESENAASEEFETAVEETAAPEQTDVAPEEAFAVTEEPAEPEAALPAEEAAPAVEEEAAPEPEVENTGEKNLDIHNYEVFTEDITWTEAFDRCIEKGGYLARIDSEEEYDVVCNLLNSREVTGIAYLGGRRDPDSEKYAWVGNDGELYDYDVSGDDYRGVWLEGEPSFHDEVDGESIDECYMAMLYRKSENRWYWNDIANDVLSLAPDYYKGSISYICEYE